MRVQAKRLQRNDLLKVKHTVKSSGEEQRDLLIANAEDADMKPVYCIYCTKPQRRVWKQTTVVPGFGSFQTGCLLAEAEDVPGGTMKLDAIEKMCWPWHHLLARAVVMREESEDFALHGEELEQFVPIWQRAVVLSWTTRWRSRRRFGMERTQHRRPERRYRREFDETGVRETTSEDLARLEPDTEAESEVLSPMRNGSENWAYAG